MIEKPTSIQLFTGKGGVGKTTLSTACALGLSQTRRTLLLSTDPAGSLGEIFGRDFSESIVTVAPNLDIVELSRRVVIAQWHEKFAEDIFTVLSSFLPVERDILDYIEGAPGIDEEFMLSWLLDAQRSGNYDAIVWDAAPTSTTLKLLELQKIFYSHLTDAQKIYLKFRGFFKDADPLALIRRWLGLTEDVIAMLKNNTSAWIVANPERLPVEQALMISKALADFGIGVNGCIINRLLAKDACTGCDFFARKFLAQRRWHENLTKRAAGRMIAIPEITENLEDPVVLLKLAEDYGLALRASSEKDAP
jgi:arsenite-transporting ATPase